MGDQMRYATSAQIIGVIYREAFQVKMFMISILWSDESEVIVYRSFLDLKEFHRQLKKRFFLENPFRKRDRVIPKFRATAMRRKIQEKGPCWLMRRMNLLENYCSDLLRCDPSVTRSSEVTRFFMPKDHDLQADFTKNSIMMLPSKEGVGNMSGQRLSVGNRTHAFVSQSYRCVGPYNTKDTKNRPFKVALDERLDVLIKDPAGWWLVENEDKQLAWFPAPYLEMCEAEEDEDEMNGIPLGGTLYCALRSYSTNNSDEVPVPIGSVVEVLRKSDDGWWFIGYNGRMGYVPSMYLQPYNNPRAGLHTLQRKLHSSSLNLATHMNSSTLNLASSGGSQSSNRYPATLYEETELKEHTTQPRGNPYRAPHLQKTHSLELLSETRLGMAVPPSQRERKDLESKPNPANRKSTISGAESSISDFSSSGIESLGRSVRAYSSSEEDPLSPPHSPKSSPEPGERNSGRSRPDESLSSSSRPEAGSCKMPTAAPRVPTRPRAHEILSRCTTMTRKAALASRGEFSLQDPIQTHEKGWQQW
ncbi:NADPH oxidase organizer 1-like isoform X1 [Oncorhynchus keta]|uniref:NADPH oxidase organizer 1-like isoform X1 n=2 Tax=Oncorhynchus keta TaxID=8018 RepID=UPI0015F9F41F|nr:NADPH oxidase organizer 1-like isoform X1 [Oncorhynchus keta]